MLGHKLIFNFILGALTSTPPPVELQCIKDQNDDNA
jgi:hypothetical protein